MTVFGALAHMHGKCTINPPGPSPPPLHDLELRYPISFVLSRR